MHVPSEWVRANQLKFKEQKEQNLSEKQKCLILVNIVELFTAVQHWHL